VVSVLQPRHRKWAITGVAAAVAVAGTVVGIRVATDSSPPDPATVVVWGTSQPLPENFLPVIGAGVAVSTGQLEARVLPGPFRLTPDLAVVRDEDLLTSEPTTSMVDGRQIVTYHLHPRARWSDGRPIDAGDFTFSWKIQRSTDPAQGGCPALVSTLGYDQIADVTGADGGRTVVVTFSRPYADWKSLFNQQLFPAHLMDAGDPAANCARITKGWPSKDGIPISGGPWKIDKAGVNPGKQSVSFTPNPAYWGRKPKVDRLIWQSISAEPTLVIGALRAGELDVAQPSPQLDLLQSLTKLAPGVVTEVKSGPSFDHLDLNVQNVHLKQKAVREAVATALDRSTVVRSSVGQVDPAARVLNNRMYMTNQREYEATNGGRYEHSDVAAARRMLEGAGYKAAADGVYVKNGDRLSLQIMTTTGNRLRAAASEVMAAELRRAGFEIRTFLNRNIFGDKHKAASLESGDFDMALYSWVGGPFLTPNQTIYASPRGSSIGQNYTRGRDPRVDELFGRLAVETDPGLYAGMANQIDTLLWDDLFTIPLYQQPIIGAYSRDIRNVSLNPSAVGIGWNANEWTVRG
jgi:peptide/nickel transport system substrate-binding protein